VSVDRLFVFALLMLSLKCRVLLLFCSNREALGIDESEKNISELSPSPSWVGDRLVDSTAGPKGSPAAEDVSKGSSAAGTGECLEVIDLFSY